MESKPIVDRKIVVPENAIRKAWQLIYTRDWPFSMMEDLAHVKIAFEKAVEQANEIKRPDAD